MLSVIALLSVNLSSATATYCCQNHTRNWLGWGFYVPLEIKSVILETFFPANLLA